MRYAVNRMNEQGGRTETRDAPKQRCGKDDKSQRTKIRTTKKKLEEKRKGQENGLGCGARRRKDEWNKKTRYCKARRTSKHINWTTGDRTHVRLMKIYFIYSYSYGIWRRTMVLVLVIPTSMKRERTTKVSVRSLFGFPLIILLTSMTSTAVGLAEIFSRKGLNSSSLDASVSQAMQSWLSYWWWAVATESSWSCKCLSFAHRGRLLD